MIWTLVILLVLALASFMFTYTVRFTEAAVNTTFGKAGDDAIKTEPGFKLKMPYPIQQVTKYDTRLRVLETRQEAQVTADDRQVVTQAYCAWRVADPKVFYERFSNAGTRAIAHYEPAENILRGALRSAMAAISKYRLDQLFTGADSGSAIPDLENEILAAVRSGTDGDDLLTQYGIEVASVGISSIVFPQSTTAAVFDRMTAERERLAQELESQGESTAQSIESAAEAAGQKILAFAANRAATIRARGEEEAAPFLSQMNENPELAVFLSQIELLKQEFGKRVTLVLPTDLPGMSLFRPDATAGLQPGEIPGGGEEREGDRR